MEVSFVNIIPSAFNPAGHNVQYFDIADDLTLPSDKFFTVNYGAGYQAAINQHVDIIPRAQAFAKGLTHIPRLILPYPHKPDGSIDYQGDWSTINGLLNAGKGYSDVPQNNGIWGRTDHGGPDNYVNFCQGYGCSFLNTRYWPTGPLNEADSIQAANNTGLPEYALHIGETEEGTEYMSQDYTMWDWFYTRLKQRYIDKYDALGIKWWIGHNYFNIGWPDMYYLQDNRMTRQAYKDAFNLPYASWPVTSFSPGRSLYQTTLISIAIYIGNPDRQSDVLGDIWQMECVRKMGKEACIFLFAVHEWRPNNYNSWTYEGSNPGRVYRQDKVPVDAAETLTYGFVGMVHGSGVAEWGAQGKVQSFDLEQNHPAAPADLWQPQGSTDLLYNAFPHYAAYNQPVFYGYSGVTDMLAFGVALYGKTFQQTKGGTRKFLKHRKRVPGGTWGAWITPSNTGMDELVDSQFDKRGYILSELNGTKLAVYWLNCFADGIKYEIEFEHPTNSSLTYNAFVGGNMVHAALINL